MPAIKSVDVKQLKEWLTQNEVVLVDVREPKEHEAMRIPSAKLIPLGSIQKDKLPDAGAKKIVIHCGIGKRSYMACEKLLREDPNLILYNLEGGISAWQHAGFETQKMTKKLFSLEQQMQMTIAIGMLLGIALGYFVHPLFFLLSIILSLALLYTGMTASPALIMLMAALPWNRAK